MKIIRYFNELLMFSSWFIGFPFDLIVLLMQQATLGCLTAARLIQSPTAQSGVANHRGNVANRGTNHRGNVAYETQVLKK